MFGVGETSMFSSFNGVRSRIRCVQNTPLGKAFLGRFLDWIPEGGDVHKLSRRAAQFTSLPYIAWPGFYSPQFRRPTGTDVRPRCLSRADADDFVCERRTLTICVMVESHGGPPDRQPFRKQCAQQCIIPFINPCGFARDNSANTIKELY